MSRTIDGEALGLARKLAQSELSQASDNAYRHSLQAKAGYDAFDAVITAHMKDQHRLWLEEEARAGALVRALA